jgi:glycosyltransferase involved in cell wall biosynthesis
LGTPTVVADTTALSEFAWVSGCIPVDYPPDYEELADNLLEAAKMEVQSDILGRRNIIPWNRVTSMLEKAMVDLVGNTGS